jgi:hypothetical protein
MMAWSSAMSTVGNLLAWDVFRDYTKSKIKSATPDAFNFYSL